MGGPCVGLRVEGIMTASEIDAMQLNDSSPVSESSGKRTENDVATGGDPLFPFGPFVLVTLSLFVALFFLSLFCNLGLLNLFGDLDLLSFSGALGVLVFPRDPLSE